MVTKWKLNMFSIEVKKQQSGKKFEKEKRNCKGVWNFNYLLNYLEFKFQRNFSLPVPDITLISLRQNLIPVWIIIFVLEKKKKLLCLSIFYLSGSEKFFIHHNSIINCHFQLKNAFKHFFFLFVKCFLKMHFRIIPLWLLLFCSVKMWSAKTSLDAIMRVGPTLPTYWLQNLR